jgi:hypothetical protein
MMKNFAIFTLSGKFPAFTVVFGFLLFALIFPLSAILSGAAIVLITLHAGPKNSLPIILACIIALALVCSVFIGNALLGATTAAVQLLPSFILASIFYSTRSLSLSLQAAAILGALTFVIVSAIFPNSYQFWQQSLGTILAPVLETGMYSAEQSAIIISQTATFMTGLLIASIVLVHSSILLFGYQLKCLADDNKQFKQDFQKMRLGKVLAVLTLLIGTWALVTQSPYAAQLCGILSIVFFLQGLAVIHTTTGTMTKGKLWLIIAYILVIFVPQAIVVVILLGIFETFFKIRERVK